MTDQSTLATTQPVATATPTITEPNFDAMPNPDPVYDELDKLTLLPDELTLMGAVTQAQVDVAEESIATAAEIEATIAAEAAEDADAAA